MPSPHRYMKLGAFLYPCGHHIAAWRHPGSASDAGVNFDHYMHLAKTAEKGLFDMVFVADNLTVWDGDDSTIGHFSYVAWFEPISLMSALAAVTNRIGLVCTSTTTYDEPFHIARRFASIDLISKGRAGWNLVTSAKPGEAKNFSRAAHPPKSDRYDRAREFAHVVLGLWDSWEPDAFIRDRALGAFFDPHKMHALAHKGEHFQIHGPLNVAPSPQGRPVVVQAGSSEDGKELAAETADVVFTAHPHLESAKLFYADIKARLSKYGRTPDDVKVMPGVSVYVGSTESEAHDKHAELQALIHPAAGLTLLSNYLGMDLTTVDPEGPLPDLPLDRLTSRAQILATIARSENLTVSQLYKRIAGSRGHHQVIGSAKQVADTLEQWFVEKGADGFNIMPPILPESLEDFVNLVIPELQKRKLFRTSYESSTLRENLGLKHPVNRYVRRLT